LVGWEARSLWSGCGRFGRRAHHGRRRLRQWQDQAAGGH